MVTPVLSIVSGRKFILNATYFPFLKTHYNYRFNEDSSIALSGSVDGTVKCWDVKSKRQEPVQTLEECKDTVTSLDVSDHEILVGSADSSVRRYDLRNGQLMTDYVGNPITSVSFTKDGQCLLIGSNGASIKLFDKSTGEMLQEYHGHLNQQYRIDAVLNNSDQIVVSGSENGYVYLWDLVEGTLLEKLDHGSVKIEENNSALQLLGNSLTIHSLSFHPEKCELLTAARGKVYVWQSVSDKDAEEED